MDIGLREKIGPIGVGIQMVLIVGIWVEFHTLKPDVRMWLERGRGLSRRLTGMLQHVCVLMGMIPCRGRSGRHRSEGREVKSKVLHWARAGELVLVDCLHSQVWLPQHHGIPSKTLAEFQWPFTCSYSSLDRKPSEHRDPWECTKQYCSSRLNVWPMLETQYFQW